jgi:RNA polymerase sigma factor (sigma-70 family)
MENNISMTDASIWSSYREGDELAFRQLYDIYNAGLMKYGFRFTRDQHVIEESIQDLFIKLWQNRKNIGPTPSVKFYLYKSFRRVLARKLEYLPDTVSYAEQDDRLQFRFEIGQDEVLMQKERLQELKRKLEAAMSGMTDRQREAIYLKFYEDLSYEEISEMMSITSKATYKLVYRALDHLRENFVLLAFFIKFTC